MHTPEVNDTLPLPPGGAQQNRPPPPGVAPPGRNSDLPPVVLVGTAATDRTPEVENAGESGRRSGDTGM
eukprot:CAMPEP_0194350934 /NCGR_PEP_ID=MMETSP0171-20130528/107905_1 /TAXON_ID=218684 /ORGANISM="Corethron pennatum, Strain L29A3" /LENGTH=68 /DNA_ID=CAMNT_0039118521 /DNA_START=652 /DNA_END=858 /DNA_ORIENTATION=+